MKKMILMAILVSMTVGCVANRPISFVPVAFDPIEIKPIEIKPIHISMDITVKVDNSVTEAIKACK